VLRLKSQVKAQLIDCFARARALFRLSSFAQNPGIVVTLVHHEDWAGFSGAVRFFSLFAKKPQLLLIVILCQDPFPHEDIVWGTYFGS
jgi:hypothetical protein